MTKPSKPVWIVVVASLLISIKVYDYAKILLMDYKLLENSLNHQKDSSNTVILDTHENPIGYLGSSLNLKQSVHTLSPFILNSLINQEDKGFYHNLGIDFFAILREIKNIVMEQRIKSGASTVTTQLVKNLLFHEHRTISIKLKEFILAIFLNFNYEKDQILESYINHIFLGQKSFGLASGAYRYFGKSFSFLNTKEQLSLLALIKAPSHNNPIYSKRNHQIVTNKFLKNLLKTKFISYKKFIHLKNQSLRYRFRKNIEYEHRHFVEAVKKELKLNLPMIKGISRGLKISTGFSPSVQKTIIPVIKFHKKKLNPKIKNMQLSSLWIDHTTGQVVSLMGGKELNSRPNYNRILNSRRSPGSLLKIIAYSLSLEKGFTKVSKILNVKYNKGYYRPKSTTQPEEYINLSKAFYTSDNFAALNLVNFLGIENFLNYAKKMGIRSSLKKEMGTIIGGSNVKQLDLARLYTLIANNGIPLELTMIQKIKDYDDNILLDLTNQKIKKPIYSEKTALKVKKLLEEVMTKGTGKKYFSETLQILGKTGTSNQSRDNWFCGIVGNFVGLIWVGTDYGVILPHENQVNASNSALPIFMDIAKNFSKKDYYQIELNSKADHKEHIPANHSSSSALWLDLYRGNIF